MEQAVQEAVFVRRLRRGIVLAGLLLALALVVEEAEMRPRSFSCGWPERSAVHLRHWSLPSVFSRNTEPGTTVCPALGGVAKAMPPDSSAFRDSACTC